MKQINKNELELIYQDSFGRFYKASSTLEKPLIFINGQLDPKIQYLLNCLGIKTLSKKFYYDETYHTPYLWVYDYDITNKNITNMIFAYSIYKAMKEYGLKNVDILGFSNGGTIALYCSQFSNVSKVLAVHPSIQGSFLVYSKDLLDSLENPSLFTQVLLNTLDKSLTKDFGYMQENGELLKDFIHLVDREKIFITHGNIVDSQNKGIHFNFGKYLAMLGYEVYNVGSDGVVVIDENYLIKHKIPYLLDNNDAHFNMNEKRIAEDYKLILGKK